MQLINKKGKQEVNKQTNATERRKERKNRQENVNI